MNKKAFAMATEAVLSLLIVASIAAFPVQQQKTNLLELLVLQKENDLLKIWLAEKRLDEKMLEKDFVFAFPGLNGEIEFRGKKIIIEGKGGKRERAVSSGALFYLENGNLAELRITVYF